MMHHVRKAVSIVGCLGRDIDRLGHCTFGALGQTISLPPKLFKLGLHKTMIRLRETLCLTHHCDNLATRMRTAWENPEIFDYMRGETTRSAVQKCRKFLRVSTLSPSLR